MSVDMTQLLSAMAAIKRGEKVEGELGQQAKLFMEVMGGSAQVASPTPEIPVAPEPAPVAVVHSLSNEAVVEALDLDDEDIQALAKAGFETLESLMGLDETNPTKAITDLYGERGTGPFIVRAKELADEMGVTAVQATEVPPLPSIKSVAGELGLEEGDLADLDKAGYKVVKDLAFAESAEIPKDLSNILGTRRALAIVRRARRLCREREIPFDQPEPAQPAAPPKTLLAKVASQLDMDEDDVEVMARAGITTLEQLAMCDPANPPDALRVEWGNYSRRYINLAIDLAEAMATERATVERAARSKGSSILRLGRKLAAAREEQKSIRDAAYEALMDAADEAGVRISSEYIDVGGGRKAKIINLVIDQVAAGSDAAQAVAEASVKSWTRPLDYKPATRRALFELASENNHFIHSTYTVREESVELLSSLGYAYGVGDEIEVMHDLCVEIDAGTISVEGAYEIAKAAGWAPQRRREPTVGRAFQRANRHRGNPRPEPRTLASVTPDEPAVDAELSGNDNQPAATPAAG